MVAVASAVITETTAVSISIKIFVLLAERENTHHVCIYIYLRIGIVVRRRRVSEASARISSQSAERILLLYKQGPPRANTARAPLRNQNNCANLYLNYSRIKINVLPCSTSSFSSAGMRRENNLSWFTPSLSFSVSLFLSRPLYGSRRIINSARPLSRQYCRLDRPLRFSAACVHCPATAYNGGFCAGVCFERCQQLSQLPSGRWQTYSCRQVRRQ